MKKIQNDMKTKCANYGINNMKLCNELEMPIITMHEIGIFSKYSRIESIITMHENVMIKFLYYNNA